MRHDAEPTSPGPGGLDRPGLLRWVHDVLAVLVPVGFIGFLWARRQHLASILEISTFDVALLCAIVVLTWAVVAGQNYLLYKASGVGIGFVECVVLTVGSAFGNYLPMRLGTLVRARYLKAVHGLRYARFGSVFAVRTLLTMVATGVLGLVGTLGVARVGGSFSPELALVFAALVVAPLLGWLVPLPGRAEGSGRLRRLLGDFGEGAQVLRQRPGTSLAVLVLIISQQATLMARFAVASAATGAEPSIPLLALLAPLAMLTSYLSVTPGGLGMREAVMGYATFATGLSFASGVYVGTVDRAILLAMVGLFGGAGFAFMWWRSRRAVGPQPPP